MTTKRQFLGAVGGLAATVAVPVAAGALPAPAGGLEWWYEVSDFGFVGAVCGKLLLPDERYQVRYGVTWRLRKGKRAGWRDLERLYPDEVARAKALIAQRIAEGKGIYGDDCVEGNEEQLPR
jgi:hypothetical protein